ncbi:MAG: HDIG domain-containing protein [Candidatus Omnitrophica bacterium]|nr:HDIG domain-containing protein [Candidatus Omnitrophota bacterium]
MAFLSDYPHLFTLRELALQKKISIYMVGGFVRDLILKRVNLDFDFAVEKNALKLAEAFADKIKGAYVLLDDENVCGRVVKKQKGIIYTYDFAQFRAPTLKQDLAHRDFSINTLLIDINNISLDEDLTAQIKDQNKGLVDLKKKTIRMVSPKIFVEDPLRVLRAYSICAVLNFKIDPNTLKQIQKDMKLLHKVSMERVREEFFKILGSPSAALVLKEMDKIGLLSEIIPQIQVMKGCKQGGYHHLDVWKHSMEALRQYEILAENFTGTEMGAYLNKPLSGTHTYNAMIKLACLLHDIGKPDTRKKEINGFSFHGHENAGKGMARHIAKMLKLSTEERHWLEDLVAFHLRPGYLANFKVPSSRAIFRFLRDAGYKAPAITILTMADQLATRGPLTTQESMDHLAQICGDLIKEYFRKQNEKPLVKFINGHDIMKALKLKPSPEVGKILREVEEAQALGKIKTKEEAVELARKICVSQRSECEN